MADGEAKIETEVLTPEGRVYSGTLYQISAATTGGEIGVRSRHVPVLARIKPSMLRLYESSQEFDSRQAIRFAVGQGWLEVFADRARVLVSEAVKPEELDSEDLKVRAAEAEARLEGADPDSAAAKMAREEKERAEAFLAISAAG